MNQSERRRFLIAELLKEEKGYDGMMVPAFEAGQKRLLRSLMNVRMPKPISDEFLRIQDEYLKAETEAKGVVDLGELKEVQPGLYIWQGDITLLKVGAIVNAANSGMTGCYQPCHSCIDNAMLM